MPDPIKNVIKSGLSEKQDRKFFKKIHERSPPLRKFPFF